MNTFYRRRDRKDPSWLVIDSLGRRLGLNKRLGDAARSDRGAVGFDRKAHPGRRDQRLVRHEGVRQRRKEQHLDHGDYATR